jgi:phage recombination protein Bet
MGRPPGSRNKTETGTELSVIENDQPKSVLIDMSNRYGMEPTAFEATVRATCMRPDKNGRIPTREEFAAFLLVAKEYNLNPLTKEIYAYASKGGGIVPIVSVDGWVNLVNSHGQCDGFEFDMEHSPDGKQLISCTCRLYRKDRSHPTTITEYFSECVRDTDPWKMKHRMLRHKAMIQAARYAFGFSGIYDPDEGEKIADIDPSKDAGPPRVAASDPKLIEGTTNPLAAEHPHDP